MLREKARIMDAAGMGRALRRMAHEIVEREEPGEELALVGIRRRGVHLARRLQQEVRRLTQREVPLGILDITLYRDDLVDRSPQPEVHRTEVPFPVEGRRLVLVDDVLYTGRTVRAALDALVDLGRPRRVELAVLVDRGHRELPIRPDYVGKNVPTAAEEIVEVRLPEVDGGVEEVVLVERPAQ